MRPHVFVLSLPLFLLFACKSGEPTVKQKEELKIERKLSEKEKVAFGRMYIDGSKEKILGNYDKAAKLFEKAIQINPASAAAHYELGLVYNSQGFTQNAFEEFKLANEIDPDNYWYKLSYATFLEDQGKIEEAILLFEELSKENPDQIELKYELSKLFLNQGKIEKGIDYLNLIEEDIGVTEEISFLKQRIYLSTNNLEKAAREIELLIETFPGELKYYNTLADIYLSNEREEEALKVLSKLEKIKSDDADLQFTLAKLYLSLGKKEKYREYISKAFANKDLNIDEKIKFILTHYQVGSNEKEKLEEAIGFAKIISEAHPDNAKSHALYADFLYFMDRDQEAIQAYKRTIAIDSSRFPVWNQFMVILSENQENEQLLNYGPRAISLFPNQPSIYLLYGLALSADEQYEEAIEYLKLGKDLVIESPALKSQFYSSIGDIYHELKKHQASDENYEQALKLDPNNIYVLNNYAYYLSLRKENLERAKEMSLKSNQISPNQSSFQDTYAWILFQLEEYDEALKWINKAIGSEANASGVLLEHKGDILFKKGKVEEAVEFWEKAKKRGGATELIDQKIKERKLAE